MSEYKVHRTRFIDYKPKAINSAAFDSHSANLKVALSREDGSIEIRDPVNDWVTLQIIPGQDDRTVEHLVWCKGRLFSAGLSGEIIEWDLEKLSPKYTQDSYGGPVWCIRFSNSEKYLAAGCEDGSVRLFEVYYNSISYEQCLHRQEFRILSFAWSKCDQFLVTGGFDCTMRMYNVKTGQIISRMTTDNLKDGNTMIWSIEFLSDLTLVMGDSLGNTQFWDGHTGTLMQSFHSHQADVLMVAVENQNTVYSTGIDSKVSQFNLIDTGNGIKWIQTKSVRATNHDTRALAVFSMHNKSWMVSGGVDPRFVVYDLSNFSSQTFVRYSCLPPVDRIQLGECANVLLYREEKKLHIWSLSDTSKEASKPQKLFEINSDQKDHLLCSAISSHSKYVAYSSVNKCCILNISLQPTPMLKKSSHKISPASLLVFTHDESTLISTGFNKSLSTLNLQSGESSNISFPAILDVSLPFYHIQVSNDDEIVCLVDSASRCFLFSLVDQSYMSQLPSINGIITAVRFHPKTGKLFIVTGEKMVYEYDMTTEKFCPWLFELNNSNLLRSMGRMKNKIDIITFNPTNPNEMFFQTKEVLGKIMYGSDIPEGQSKTVTKKKKKQNENPLKEHGLFNNMMYFGFNSLGEMVVVEQPMTSILQDLPQPLKIKKFGS